VRESEYQGRALVKEFKRGINEVIRRKLMETERSLQVLNSGTNMLLI